jgi:hypothetical protein
MISLWQFGKSGCHDELFNLIKGMKMVRNNKTGAGLALVAALLGMGMSGAASALPELQVGTLPPIVAPSSVNTVDSTDDSTVAEPVDVDTADTTS